MKTVNTNSKHKTTDVILIRHAQSQWNKENRFTGWANPPLTDDGVKEATEAGKWLAQHGFHFDAAYSSRLERAITTLDILLSQAGQPNLQPIQDWRLNERHYGSLQGVNKAKAASQVGEHQVWRWRRGYEDRATPLLRYDPQHPVNDPLYFDVAPELLPGVENLAQTRERVMQFWRDQIVPHLYIGKRVLISAHGNTLRALLMGLSEMTVAEVESFEIPTATPILYRFDNNASPLDWCYLDTGLSAAKLA